MSRPAAGHADFQEYASWQGTPSVTNLVTYPAGTTVITDLNLANYQALYMAVADITGHGALQLQFFTDSTKSQSVDVYQYILSTGNTLVLNVPMVSPFVEISAVVHVGQSLELSTVFTPNNSPVLRPTYAGQVRNASAEGLVIGAGGVNDLVPQYVISGAAYVFFRPEDATGKLDLNIWALDADGNEAYRILKFSAPTGPTWASVLLPPAPIQIHVVNNDGANPHTCGYTVQMIGD